MSSPVALSFREQTSPSLLLTALPTSEQSRAQSLALTVIVPVYNERHLVATSVGRLLAVTSEHISRLEVIIVDDCSTDGSREVLERLAAQDARIRLIRYERN